ncbi:hypothetical protein OZX74_03235 [Bifidobacterium sp. ESL0798]|uniref:hypothetical protein n=1 Tax=Bifidobacterium sp. ESL0798 TaxID=2983235 RepID=UPI0023F791F5|nr:hypothetical protein [Bifidobacterium sp. ESL0798]WEV74554.1 hypothetical protein OZX74_03235 [Bifidobacterium sp. ESL0798]
MAEIATIVRLKWALMWATMRKSVWQAVNFALTGLIGLAVVIGIGVFAWKFGPDPHMPKGINLTDGMRFVMVLWALS